MTIDKLLDVFGVSRIFFQDYFLHGRDEVIKSCKRKHRKALLMMEDWLRSLVNIREFEAAIPSGPRKKGIVRSRLVKNVFAHEGTQKILETIGDLEAR